MIDAITLSCYAGGQIGGIAAELQYLQQIALDAPDPVAPGLAAVAACPQGRAITAAIAGRFAGFVLCLPHDAEGEPDLTPIEADLGVGQSSAFTRSALRISAPVVAPAATGLGVSELLLDAARPQQPDGRIFTLLPAGHPGNRVVRAAGWHEVLRSRSGMQLLVHPDHPVLASILLQA